MPQNNIYSMFKTYVTNKLVPALVDANTSQQLTSRGGAVVAFDQTSTGVIKASAGRVARIIVIAPGTTSGALTLNDSATLGGAAIGNQLFTIAYGSMSAGQIIDLDLPFANGLVISSVPGGGSPIYNISYV